MNKAPRVVVAGLIRKNNKYLLAKEKLSDGSYWLIPGGGVEFGESLEQAVKRELLEELGVSIKIKDFLGFNEVIFPKVNYHSLVFFYLVESSEKAKLLDPKMDQIKYFSLKEIKTLRLVESAEWLFKQFFYQ